MSFPLGSLGAKSRVSNTCRISTSVSSKGARLSHSIASSLDFTCQSQTPATSSFVSAKGPSTTVCLPLPNLTRAPFELGCSPSPASITPAFTSSSLNFPISASIFSLGSSPASDSLFAFTITMNRMSSPLVGSRASRTVASGSVPGSTSTSNDRPRDRHGKDLFLAAACSKLESMLAWLSRLVLLVAGGWSARAYARRQLAGPFGYVVRGLLGISIAKELVEMELFILAVCLVLGLYVRLGVSSTFHLLAPWQELLAMVK